MTATPDDGHPFEPAARLRGVELSVIRKLHNRAVELGEFVNLGLGEPDLPLPDVVRRAAERALRERKVIGYTPNAGLPELRRAIAASYAPDGGDASAGRLLERGIDEVCVTCGSQEALWVVLQTLVDPGDEVLVPDPGFVSYPTCVRLAGGRPVPYRLPASRGYALDRDGLAARLSPRTRAVLLNSPSNPTGQVLGRADVEAVAALLGELEAEHGRPVWLIADEIYAELYYDDGPAVSAAHLGDPARTVVVSGLSKSMCMTGWRLGWVLGPAQLLRHAVAVHQYTAICAPTLSQLAGLAAFTPEGTRARDEIRAVLRERRKRVLGFARDEAEGGCTVPAGAFYVLLDVGEHGGDCAEVARRLLEQERVLTIPGGGFGEESKGTLRISFATDRETLDEGLRRIGRGLRRLRR